MKALNYWRHARKDLESDYKRVARSNDPKHKHIAGLILSVVSLIETCPNKFILPDNGGILADGLKGLDKNGIRLPFPVITIEYQGVYDDNAIDKHIILAYEDLPNNRILCIPITNTWDSREASGKNKFFLSQLGIALPLNNVLAPDGYWNANLVHLTQDLKLPEDSSDILEYMRNTANPVLELIEALSCKNVVPQKMPHKHSDIKHKALGFDEYYTLMVHSNKDSSSVNKHSGGSHRHAREHLRRGHIRRHPTAGNIWINSMVVNAGVGGKIHKTYVVQP